MRKTIAAVTVGLLLVAGQAVAQNNSSTVRIGDRVGAQADDSSELVGIPIAVLVVGAAALIGLIAVVSDDGESD